LELDRVTTRKHVHLSKQVHTELALEEMCRVKVRQRPHGDAQGGAVQALVVAGLTPLSVCHRCMARKVVLKQPQVLECVAAARRVMRFVQDASGVGARCVTAAQYVAQAPQCLKLALQCWNCRSVWQRY
jgi:hypothetical protein